MKYDWEWIVSRVLFLVWLGVTCCFWVRGYSANGGEITLKLVIVAPMASLFIVGVFALFAMLPVIIEGDDIKGPQPKVKKPSMAEAIQDTKNLERVALSCKTAEQIRMVDEMIRLFKRKHAKDDNSFDASMHEILQPVKYSLYSKEHDLGINSSRWRFR